jgi:hypothetical protein
VQIGPISDPAGDGSAFVEWGSDHLFPGQSPKLPATAGATYRWEGYLQSSCAGDGSTGIAVRFFNASDTQLSSTLIATIVPPADTWAPFSTDVVAPVGTAYMTMVPLGIGACRAYYDKIRVFEHTGEAPEQNPYAGQSPYAARCDHTHPAEDHDHDSDYAPISHDHDADYSAAGHNHDADYAAIDHEHPLRWEAVTDGEDVFVWEGDDLVHEWKAY